MQTPLDIKFKNFNDKGEIEELIKERANKLDRLCKNIISCHVLVEEIQHEQHTKHSYHIRITVNIPPHHELVIKRDPEKGKIGVDYLSKILREAFEAMERKVKQINDKMHKKVKAHTKATPEIPEPEPEIEEDFSLET